MFQERENVFLLGFMGSGKSVVGRLLAEALGKVFVDTDCYIEASVGQGIEQIVSEYGEENFRHKEQRFLQSLERKQNLVLACGGGMPCYGDNMRLISDLGASVFLDVSPQTLCKRLLNGKNKGRFLLQNLLPSELPIFIETKLHQRMPFYIKSDFVVKNEDSPQRCVSEILNLLNAN